MRRGIVPAAPFVEILSDRLDQLERAEVDAPKDSLAEESGVHRRLVYLLVAGKQENIGFDNADRIVTNLVGPMAWWEDETLNEIYMSVDLEAVDKRWPVTQAVAA